MFAYSYNVEATSAKTTISNASKHIDYIHPPPNTLMHSDSRYVGETVAQARGGLLKAAFMGAMRRNSAMMVIQAADEKKKKETLANRETTMSL